MPIDKQLLSWFSETDKMPLRASGGPRKDIVCTRVTELHPALPELRTGTRKLEVWPNKALPKPPNPIRSISA